MYFDVFLSHCTQTNSNLIWFILFFLSDGELFFLPVVPYIIIIDIIHRKINQYRYDTKTTEILARCDRFFFFFPPLVVKKRNQGVTSSRSFRIRPVWTPVVSNRFLCSLPNSIEVCLGNNKAVIFFHPGAVFFRSVHIFCYLSLASNIYT